MLIQIIYTKLTIIEILHDILRRFCTLSMLHVQVPLSCYCHFIMFVLNDSILSNLRHAMIFTNKLPVLVRYIYLYYIIYYNFICDYINHWPIIESIRTRKWANVVTTFGSNFAMAMADYLCVGIYSSVFFYRLSLIISMNFSNSLV